MYKNNVVLLILVLIICCCFAGCGGHRYAKETVGEDGYIIEWRDKNHTLLQPSLDPVQFGRAKVLKSEADINTAIALRISQGKSTEVLGGKKFFVRNIDESKTFDLIHPFLGVSLPFKPQQ